MGTLRVKGSVAINTKLLLGPLTDALAMNIFRNRLKINFHTKSDCDARKKDAAFGIASTHSAD